MLNKSENINENYAARICRVDAIEPIPDAHSIVYATLGVDKVVVGKDTKVGDIVVFFPIGAAISSKYLSANNLYERSEAIRNSNYDELCKVQADINLLMVKNPKTEEDIVKLQELQTRLKRLVGFFNKNGVVRMLKLRGVPSMGYVASVSTLEEVWPELKETLWNKYLNEPFDMIGEDRLCWKWLPNKKPRLLEERVPYTKGYWWKKRMKKLKRFDRLVPGQFEFHYDTKMLKDNMHVLFPDTPVTITVKMHGTSVIISNILTNKKLSTWEKIKKRLGFKVEEQVYDNVYSSRKVIKNQYINPGKPNQYYSADPHGCVNRDFAEYLSPGMTVYGEIVGYEESTSRCIQHPKGIDHDYGCEKGEWAFMPYRITTTNSEGKVREWSLHEILVWNEVVRSKMLNKADTRKLKDITILYQGPMDGLYPGLYSEILAKHTYEDFNKAVSDYKHSESFNGFMPKYLESYQDWINHLWRIEVLEKMKNDQEQLGMELPEPLCKNKKAPREGIVLRIIDDPEQRAWKLKTVKHMELSQKAADAGEQDMEDNN